VVRIASRITVGLALLIAFTVSLSGLGAYFTYSSTSHVEPPPGQIELLASSPAGLFVGAVGDRGYLYVGLLNGTVEKMDAQSGTVMGTVALPDRNSAAHLLSYNGSLYVGTEFLTGARDKAPYHIYRIDPMTLQISARVAMNLSDANGFVQAYNGYLWAGDGGCTLYKIKPSTLSVDKTVTLVAEDEMAYDGTYYWTQCGSVVSVLKPDSLTRVAMGSLPAPARPRGFFVIGSRIFSTDSANFTRFRMSVSGGRVVFENVRSFYDHTIWTRDACSVANLTYFYGTRDDQHVQARIVVYDGNYSLETSIALSGNGLGTDASQHTMFVLNQKIYFVTQSSIGYFIPLDALKV
jgi:hypothetical protein